MVIYLMCLFKSFDSKILKFCLLHTEFYLFYKFEDFFFKSLNIRSIQNKPDHLIETYFSEETHSLGRFFYIISLLICIFLWLVRLMYLYKKCSMTPTYSLINLKTLRFNLQFSEIKAITETSSSWMKSKMFYSFVGRALFTLLGWGYKILSLATKS